MRIDARFADLLAIYRAELLERTIPFWITHAFVWDIGGILTCFSDVGLVLSRDMYMWSQLRAIWTFSALYNHIEARQEWLDVARHIFEFAQRYGRDKDGRWVFAVDEQGSVLQGATSIYADGFAIYGLTELARATGDPQAVAAGGRQGSRRFHDIFLGLSRIGSLAQRRGDPLSGPPASGRGDDRFPATGSRLRL